MKQAKWIKLRIAIDLGQDRYFYQKELVNEYNKCLWKYKWDGDDSGWGSRLFYAEEDDYSNWQWTDDVSDVNIYESPRMFRVFYHHWVLNHQYIF